MTDLTRPLEKGTELIEQLREARTKGRREHWSREEEDE
jgi:hypothetical protein